MLSPYFLKVFYTLCIISGVINMIIFLKERSILHLIVAIMFFVTPIIWTLNVSHRKLSEAFFIINTSVL